MDVNELEDKKLEEINEIKKLDVIVNFVFVKIKIIWAKGNRWH